MRVLLAHNYYQQSGGEDQSFAAEVAALRAHGHTVLEYHAHNDAVRSMGRFALALKTVWNHSVHTQFRDLVRQFRPDVVHFNNTFPLISPAAYYAVRAEGVPVVQSLRNYRLLCPNALFYRDGKVCEDCLHKKLAWPGVVHKCYRGDRATSAMVATMVHIHRTLGTWNRTVDLYIALTQFAKSKFVEAGFRESQIAVKPNFVHPDPLAGDGRGGYAVFLGRLSPEKGVETMISAWRKMGPGAIPLKIIGDGPLAEQVKASITDVPTVQWLGHRKATEAYEIIGGASLLVLPSQWYETFGRVAVEAFAKGTPVVASRIGAVAELVEDGRTGMLFTPGDAGDLAAKVGLLLADADRLARMRQVCRDEYERKYTARQNYRQLRRIYEQAIERVSTRKRVIPLALAGEL